MIVRRPADFGVFNFLVAICLYFHMSPCVPQLDRLDYSRTDYLLAVDNVSKALEDVDRTIGKMVNSQCYSIALLGGRHSPAVA